MIGPLDQQCGAILWESKRTKSWTDAWLAKLREDQRKPRRISHSSFPMRCPKARTFDHIDGVWVTESRCAIPVAMVLRQSLNEIATVRQAGEDQHTKMEITYHYLTSPRFRQRLEAIGEKFSDMQEYLDRERKAMTRLWAKQIREVIAATAGMYGDLQGIAGRALKEIDGIGLPLIEDKGRGR